MKKTLFSLLFVFCIVFMTVRTHAQEPYIGSVQQIDIINWSHTDYGFTDHPLMVREIHKHYIDIALDYVQASISNKQGEQFCWTIESLDPLYEWWRQALEDRRQLLLQAIQKGNIDVNVMPFNIHPLLNNTEISRFLNWIPEALYRAFNPRVAIQNDVNGFQRAIASRLSERGVRYVFLGMNGRHPFPIPTLSWWQMPNGEKLLIWNGGAYWEAYNYLGIVPWRAHPREIIDLATRWPRDGELLPADEQSVRKAHAQCIRNLNKLHRQGYRLSVLPITFSNQWRGDNDGPYWGWVPFVQKWNELGLQPRLVLTTATASMQRLEKDMPDNTPVYTGEFGDWWAFGMTALPREMATARKARYHLQASVSPVFHNQDPEAPDRTEQVNRDLCVFYEHTFASKNANSDMYGEFNQGSINEANRYAYKAYENACWQLARQTRSFLGDSLEGVYVINTQERPFFGWVETEFSALRNRKAVGVCDLASRREYALLKEKNRVRFWVEGLEPLATRHYRMIDELTVESKAQSLVRVQTDADGWPVFSIWPGMEQPLFDGSMGDFVVYRMTKGGWWGGDGVMQQVLTIPKGKTRMVETGYSFIYEQELTNERLVSLKRILEIYKEQPRANLRVVYDRKLHPEREKDIFYVQIPLPRDREASLLSSNGGGVFSPYGDHFPNTCQRFFTVDAWVAFQGTDGTRVWASRTSPIVSFGDNEFHRREVLQRPDDVHLIRSMVYNNCWGLNFPVEYSGCVVCDYDLYWSPGCQSADEICKVTDTYLVQPVFSIVPKHRENPVYRKWMNGDTNFTKK